MIGAYFSVQKGIANMKMQSPRMTSKMLGWKRKQLIEKLRDVINRLI